MTSPVRIQLSRRAGFNLQAASLALNGLAAVNCARPGRWGNPFSIADNDFFVPMTADQLRGLVAHRHRCWIDGRLHKDWTSEVPPSRAEIIAKLRGKNLACWCPLGSACHANFLLELANDRGILICKSEGCGAPALVQLCMSGDFGRLDGFFCVDHVEQLTAIFPATAISKRLLPAVSLKAFGP